jgi:hypothetical protein
METPSAMEQATTASAPIQTYPTHPSAEPPRARGDAITGERYWSREFAALEWERIWKRVWHVGGRERQLEKAGEYITRNMVATAIGG